jgi:hypothetical protein
MEIHVHSYLSRHFEIGTSEVGNDGIYSLEDKRKNRAPIYGNKLVTELVTVFAIAEDEGKNFINTWAVKINPKIDLEFYWATNEDIFEGILPLVQRVAARTIGMDLVSVQPLAAPTGQLLYFDYAYTGVVETQTATTNNRVYEVAENDAGRRWDNIIQQLYENQQRFDGELNHPDNV